MSSKLMGDNYSNDFLWFSLLGITKSENNTNDLLLKCIMRAYLDLSRTVKYTNTSNALEMLKKKDIDQYKLLCKQKSDLINNVRDIIKYYVTQLLELEIKKTQEAFDQWHEEICEKIRKVDDKNGVLKDGLTYGQAQKWVNMTLKYMLVTGEWDDKLEHYKSFLHVPLDSYIIAAAKQNEKEKIYDGMAIYGLGVEDRIGTWSKITDYEKYLEYQKAIRKKVKSPIDWEGQAWIAQAKREKGEKSNNK